MSEQAVFMDLFENSFPVLYRQAVQNYTFKMDVLEAFVIVQVSFTELIIFQLMDFALTKHQSNVIEKILFSKVL